MTPDEVGKMGLYVLDDNHQPRQVYSMEEWGKFLHSERKRVGGDQIGDVWVSTVFLGIDHNYFDDGPPVLFETMVFGGKYDEEQWRCCTWDEAQAQHARAVAQVRASLVAGLPTSSS